MIRNKRRVTVVCDGDVCSMQIYKKPDIRTKRKMAVENNKRMKNAWDHRHDGVKKDEYKYGIFAKRGYVVYAYYKTKEEAEKALTQSFNNGNYCVREILEW